MAPKTQVKQGAELVREFRALMEKRGWRVHEAPHGTRRKKGRFINAGEDLFGCFDLLGLQCFMWEDGENPPIEVWLVQVTTKAGRPARRHRIRHGGPWPQSCRVSLAFKEDHRWVVEDFDGEWRRLEVDSTA